MHACCRCFDVHIDPNITHAFCCDSESLLKCISRALHRSWINPSQCLASDFDLESGIPDLIKTPHVSFQCLHVKSHQDDSMEIHLLPWVAQMNVHTDSLATDFLDNCAEPAKLAPFTPASQASLTIHGETITRRCASGLRQAANSPQICQHLMARNDWTCATFRSINWEAPGKAMNTLENSVKTFIVKFAHDLLPTCRHMHGSKSLPPPPVPHASTSLKPPGTFLAALADPRGAPNCSAPWENCLSLITHNSTLLSFCFKAFEAPCRINTSK
jgi:hypothetical protein